MSLIRISLRTYCEINFEALHVNATKISQFYYLVVLPAATQNTPQSSSIETHFGHYTTCSFMRHCHQSPHNSMRNYYGIWSGQLTPGFYLKIAAGLPHGLGKLYNLRNYRTVKFFAIMWWSATRVRRHNFRYHTLSAFNLLCSVTLFNRFYYFRFRDSASLVSRCKCLSS